MSRSDYVDRLRGLAVAVMIVDHILHLVAPWHPARFVTRVAMPLFALLAGHLARHPRLGRWVGLVLAGVAVALAIPWIDNPNILCWLGGGMGIAYVVQYNRLAASLVVAVALTLGANHYSVRIGSGFGGPYVIALCVLGSQMARADFDWMGQRVPGWLAWAGRNALAIYIGHLAVLAIIWGLA